MSKYIKNNQLVCLFLTVQLFFLSFSAHAKNLELSDGISADMIKFKYRQGLCARNQTGQHVYLNNTHEEYLRVTVRIRVPGRRFDRLKSYYIQPKGEEKIGCSRAYYKNNAFISYDIEKIKLVTSYG